MTRFTEDLINIISSDGYLFGRGETMPGPEIRKLYYSTQEVCELVEVRPYNLKQWEKKFAELKPSISKTGRRLYKPKDVGIIRHIKKLSDQGRSDDEINLLLHSTETKLLNHNLPSQMTITDIIRDLKEILRLIETDNQNDPTSFSYPDDLI